MSERDSNTFPPDLALQMSAAGSPPLDDFKLWYEVNSRRQGFRLSVEALDQCGKAGSLLEACIYFNNFFGNCKVNSDGHYYAADVKRIRKGEGRPNVGKAWKVRDRVYKNRRDGSATSNPCGGIYNRLGTFTHKTLLPLLSGELPQIYLPTLGREIDEVYLNEVQDHLDELERVFDGREGAEVFVAQRPLVESFHTLLAEALAPHTQKLTGARDSQDGYIRSLFLRSWGHILLYALKQRRDYPVFREMTLPKVKIFESGKSITPGIVDGIWLDKVDGNPLKEEDKKFLWGISTTGIRSFDRLIKALAGHFGASFLSFGILELKSLGESYRGLLKPKDVAVGPRPVDRRQTLMYGALMDHYFRENIHFPGCVRRIEWIYAFAQPPISYLEDLTKEEIDEYIEGLRLDEKKLECTANARKKEAELYDHIAELLDRNGSSDLQICNPSLIK